ncbi:MAG: HAMP domain-containing protein [bacterium]|nr:HAMP domain-containing protein [bacterium]
MLSLKLRKKFHSIKRIGTYLSFRARVILVSSLVLLLSILFLTAFSLKLISTSIDLWTKKSTEETLERVLAHAPSPDLKLEVEEALQEYRQLKALQLPLKREIIRFGVLLSVLAFAISSVLIWLFIRHLTKPLERLTLAAKSIAEGNLGERLKMNGAPGEVSRLIDAFNHMVAALRNAQAELRKAERVAAWRDVAQVLAHEVKNPLTPIQLSIERIKKKWGKPEFEEVLEEDSEIILEEIERLKRLTREFSNFARPPRLSLRKEEIVEGHHIPPSGSRRFPHLFCCLAIV